jgi:hypothetical protein
MFIISEQDNKMNRLHLYAIACCLALCGCAQLKDALGQSSASADIKGTQFSYDPTNGTWIFVPPLYQTLPPPKVYTIEK